MIRLSQVVTAAAGTCVFLLGSALPVQAQYGRPVISDPAVGEKYHVEASILLWNPSLDAVISSESLGIVGSEIDVKQDLGYEDKSIRELRFVLRPGRKHKFRIGYTPISFDSDTMLERRIVFNGIAFDVGLPVQSDFVWNTWRFGYEYDFVYRDRGYVGFIVETRITDASLDLRSPIDSEFSQAKGPIPALGGAARFYPVRNLAIGGELTLFKVPEIDGYEGSFYDLDIYGTYNFTHNFGVSGGWRTLDLNYLAESDTGDLRLSGIYFAGVARF
jgi:hypothetical protein